ncbi:MAG TPA: hypothetical protein PKH39_01215 [Woeseiaceae bacterium]|nr:hypothetical protein [Woeseiaceae bacterium]
MKHNLLASLIKVVAVVALLVSSVAATAATGSYKAQVAIDGNAIVDIANYKGSVVVRGDDVDTVTIQAWITIDERYARTDPQKAGRLIAQIKRTLPITSDGRRVSVNEVSKHTHKRFATIDYEILVPSGSAVTVHSALGDVLVSGVAGEVNATSDKGDVTVAELQNRKKARTRS